MKKFMELWAFEWNRAKRFYGFLIILVAGLQAYAVLNEYRFWKGGYERMLRAGSENTLEGYLNNNGYISFDAVTNNSFFGFSIVTAIFCLLFYAVAIWYQDWTGKDRFSFRLLSLPGSRFSVYAAKFATIWLMITGLQALQIGLLFVEELIFSGLMPAGVYMDLPLQSVIPTSSPLSLALPGSFSSYLFYYSAGYAALTLGYTFILMHLSVRWRGVILAGVVASVLLVSALLFLRTGVSSFLYAEEKYWAAISIHTILFIAGTRINDHLLKNRISV
jgi:hypothetical protein